MKRILLRAAAGTGMLMLWAMAGCGKVGGGGARLADVISDPDAYQGKTVTVAALITGGGTSGMLSDNAPPEPKPKEGEDAAEVFMKWHRETEKMAITIFVYQLNDLFNPGVTASCYTRSNVVPDSAVQSGIPAAAEVTLRIAPKEKRAQTPFLGEIVGFKLK